LKGAKMPKSIKNEGAAKLAVPKRKKFNDGLPEILLPTVDAIFKKLFGDERNKDILADFLTAVLGFDVEEEDIILIDPTLKREDPDDKLGVLDVKLRLESGKIINVEMQVKNFSAIRHRSEYYISKMTAAQLCENDDHRKLLPVVQIIIINDILLHETKKFHCKFSMLEEEEHFKLHDLRTVHTLELPKLPADGSGKLEEWMNFIKSKKREDFMIVAEKSKPMKRALEELEVMSASEATRMIYEYRIKMARDERARMHDAIEEGLARGMAEGMAEGMEKGLAKGMEKGMEKGMVEGIAKGETNSILRTAKAMKAENIDVNTIAKITGLTVDDILRL
jgi:predicted transposase/invertase (TIGR01784 family)